MNQGWRVSLNALTSGVRMPGFNSPPIMITVLALFAMPAPARASFS